MRAIYDWDLWTNGEEHTAEWGEDFNCTIPSFIALLHSQAKQREGIERVETTTDGTKVTFRFFASSPQTT